MIDLTEVLKRVDVTEDGIITRKNGSIAAQFQRNQKTTHLTVSIQDHPYAVHRLVATKYLPNPDNLPCVNHKDEDPTNNHVSNLEWCTHQYNTDYSVSKPLSLERDGLVKYFKSQSEAGRYIGASSACVSDVHSGKQLSTRGWRLAS